jgi:large subunit ribosomal protein L4
MAAPKAPVLGGAKKEVSLDEAVFAADIRPHLVHEAVRAELNARRQGTRAAKSRGLVAGGRSKPWRQKGTGRARQGTIRAPQFTGGGVAFPPVPRDFSLKVNKKAARAALRAALSDMPRPGRSASSPATRSRRRRRSRPPSSCRAGARRSRP